VPNRLIRFDNDQPSRPGAHRPRSNSRKILLLGNYMAGQFNIATDGHGGTVVFDPPVSSTDHNQLAPANTHPV
jgi:hypothetical protein